MNGRLEVLRTNFRDFGHFGSFLTFLTDDLSLFLIKFWSFLVIFGHFWSIGGPGGSGQMVEGSGKGQLRAWQGSGEGSGAKVGEGSGLDFGQIRSILVIFRTLSRIRKIWQWLRDLSKRWLYAGDFGQNLDGRVILGSKI